MTEQPSDDGNWVFGKGRFRVRLEDLREDLKPEFREWADEVGWTQNWAISIAVHHRNRTDVDYIKWHALVAVIMEAYDTNVLWTDSGTDTPQYNMRLNEFIPSLISDQADDLRLDEPPSPAPVSEPAPTPAPARPSEPEPEMEIPDSVLEALKAQMRAEMQPTAPEQPQEPDVEDEEPQRLVHLEPVDVDDDDFDTFDDWDDEDEDEDEDDDESDLGPITDWD